MIEIRHRVRPRDRYDQIYQGDRIHQMESFFLWICRLLRTSPGERLLDVSTGRGQMVKAARSLGLDAYGLDYSMQACRLAAQNARGSFVSCANGEFVPIATATMDFVTILGSLEHFDDMERGVREVVRILKRKGRACFTVPNTFGLRWNANVAWKTGDIDDDGQPIQRYGTRDQWASLLESNGLKVNQVLGYEHELAWPRTRRDLIHYATHPSRLIRLFLVRMIPVNMAGQFVFLCSPSSIQPETPKLEAPQTNG